MNSKKIAHFSPGRIILLSIFCAIIIGTILLTLPFSQKGTQSIKLIDLFFTATSAICVTGLFTIPLDTFTLFGQTIILTLIQIGGLGLITMILLFMYLIIDVGLATQLMASQLLEIETWKKIKKILIVIFFITFVSEVIGTISIMSTLKNSSNHENILFLSIFHTISSFCNAGIPLLFDTIPETTTNYYILSITTLLMLIGGLGFITWYEIMQFITLLCKKKQYRFSLHSKIVLYGSTTLLFSSTIIFWILERDNILAPLNIPARIISSLFHIVSFKGAGFLITHPGELQLATLLMIMIICFIGSSPGSTGSGIKITNCAIFLATIKSAITGRSSVEIKGRSIPLDQVYNAISIVSLGLCWIIFVTFCLLITEKNWQFLDIFFEVISAFTTLGITTGVTPTLSIAGKFFIIASMIIGRIGSLTLILGLKFRKNKNESTHFSYPEERVMLS